MIDFYYDSLPILLMLIPVKRKIIPSVPYSLVAEQKPQLNVCLPEACGFFSGMLTSFVILMVSAGASWPHFNLSSSQPAGSVQKRQNGASDVLDFILIS